MVVDDLTGLSYNTDLSNVGGNLCCEPPASGAAKTLKDKKVSTSNIVVTTVSWAQTLAIFCTWE